MEKKKEKGDFDIIETIMVMPMSDEVQCMISFFYFIDRTAWKKKIVFSKRNRNPRNYDKNK